MNIYTPIIPTYLCIKQHSVTKLKYFCKTVKKDPIKYLGSGTHWLRHIKKHGKQFVETIWLSDLYYDTSITEHALHFSRENSIVESTDWANLILENGLDGAPSGNIRPKTSDETKAKMSAAAKGRINSAEARAKVSAANKGRTHGPHSEETKSKISAANKGRTQKPISEETRIKMSEASKGRTPSTETKAKMSASQKNRSPETRARISAAHTGKKLSDETKAKISASKKGKKQSDEHIAKKSAALMGGKRSDETKAKMSAAQKDIKSSLSYVTNASSFFSSVQEWQ